MSAFAGGIVVGGLTNLIQQSLEATDHLGKLSARLGLTTDAVQELRYAGDLSGLKADEVDDGPTCGKANFRCRKATKRPGGGCHVGLANA